MTAQQMVVNEAPSIDLDVNSIPPVPGQNGFAVLDFSGDIETGLDGQTEEDDGEGEFVRYVGAGVIDGQTVDVVATLEWS